MPHSEAEQDHQSDLATLEALLDPILPAAASGEVEMLTCRVSRQKNQALKAWCKENGINFADWVRSKLYDDPLPRSKPAKHTSILERQIYVELNAIGINLNQTTRKLNSQEQPYLNQDDRALLYELLEKLNDIQAKLAE